MAENNMTELNENVSSVDTADSSVSENITESVNSTDPMVLDDPGSPKKKRWPIILGVIVIALLAVYGIGAYYYQTHFPHNLTVNGYKLGESTVEEAEKMFTEDYDAHSITLVEKERKEIINASEIGTVIDVGNQVKDLFATMNPWLWFTNVFGKDDRTLTLDVTFDEKALKEKVKALECFKKENIVAPVSASIQAGESQFEIIPEELGNTVLKKPLLAKIEECLSTCQTEINLEESDLYLLPQYFAKDQVVIDALEKANTYSKGTIVHDFTYQTETIDYKTSNKWVKISKDFDVKLDSSAVGDYVESLGKKYNTMGSSRPFTTANGNKIRVYDGDYGWRIDFQKEKAKLCKELKSGEDVNRKPIYSYTAAVQSKESDLGDSYVEVSIDAQEVWLFVDGECIMNSSVVTGRPGFDTEKGVYGITYKKRHTTLNGYNADGTPYASPVEYWMPFNGNQGLHDASWRDDFGGSIWKSNGSHGCVNCPTWAAATLYEHVKENFPVIIY
ncbi:MAG: peptidoglycan binding domain-containing protein [Eubacteriales bacterium]|nr:peptidoglycan binding domain-containing protein [Eubacteriales bacterium]